METGKRVTVLRYESISAYIDACKGSLSASGGPSRNSLGDNWDLGIGEKRAIDLSVDGDPSIVASQTDAINRVSAGTGEAPRFTNVNGVSGSRVNVSAYIAGRPMCMVRRTRAPRTIQHVSLYVSIVCSQSIHASAMLIRGATIIALLETLQSSQVGVDLYLVVETHGKADGNLFQIIKVDSQPLDLSVAGFAIAHPAFARNVTYNHASRMDGFNGSWPRDYDAYACGPESRYGKLLRGACGMAGGDLHIPAPHSSSETIIQNPEKYVSECMTQFGL